MAKLSTWIPRLRRVQQALAFYSSLDNYYDGIAGQQTLFGVEPDEGETARAADLDWGRLYADIAATEATAPPKRPEPFAATGNPHTDIWAKTFAAANHRALSALSWQGHCHHGPGALCIASRWQLNDGTLRHHQQIDYLPAATLLEQIPCGTDSGDRLRTGLDNLAPTQGYLLIFYGQDLRHWELGRDRPPQPDAYILIAQCEGDPPGDAIALGLRCHAVVAAP